MYEVEVAFARGLADRAGEIAMGQFLGEGLEVRRKADLSLVTLADTSVERALREQIEAAFPGDRILGEEEGGSHEAEGRVWILDPVDGTANFARRIPVWGTLIALQVDGVSVLGLANAPALGERYEAVLGQGASFNGQPCHVSEISVLSDAQVVYQELKDLTGGRYRDAVLELARASWRDRGFGDFWSHMLVARGAAEVVLEPELWTWDYAAVQVIVEEAGGRVSTFEGGPLEHGGSMLTTNGLLHDEVLRRLASAG